MDLQGKFTNYNSTTDSTLNLTKDSLLNLTTDSIFAENSTNVSKVDDENVALTGNDFLFQAYPTNLAFSMLAAFSVAIVCVSVFLNGFLFHSLSKTRLSVLKAKYFVQNNCIGNIMFTVFSGIDVTWFLMAFNISSPSLKICSSAFYFLFTSCSLILQSICSLGLAADRLYASIRPIQYYTAGYNKTARVMMVLSPWFMTIIIWGIIILTTPGMTQQSAAVPWFCQTVEHYAISMIEIDLLDCFLLSCNLLPILIYIVTFIFIRLQSRKLHSQINKKEGEGTLSLVITFFFLNVMNVSLYAPVPIYGLLNDPSFVPLTTILLTMKGFLFLYMVNSCLHSLVLMFRIRSIRQNVFQLFSPRPSSRERQQTLSVSASDTQGRN